MKYGLAQSEIAFGNRVFEAELEGKLQLEAAISAGKRWVWSPGFTLLAGLGLGVYSSGYDVSCPDTSRLNGAINQACLDLEGKETDVWVMLNLEVSVGWAF